MSSRPISISTLSPIHIGCDEVYEPSNFVIADGLLHALDLADLADALSDNERKALAGLADGREPIGALQRFFRDNAERFAALSHHQVAIADAIVREYEKSAGRPTQRGAAGEPTYNLFPIARTAYRPLDENPYLPGSSLKGSIRTAWLNRCNEGKPITDDEWRDPKTAPRRLQERLLGYAAGKFENDPFRHVALADAHPDEDDAPPTRVLYAISKKKRQPREGESGSPELKVFLETVPDALPAAFLGELRLSGKMDGEWNALCDACTGFYRPQLEAELDHAVLGGLLDKDWKLLVGALLSNELGDLMAARQGFLLRVGRHSGAESVTLDGVRNIKILGKKGEPPSYRPNTTEKRYASLTKDGADGLLPFGWVWVGACDDAHRDLFDALRQKLAARGAAVRQAHQDRLLRLEEKQQRRAAAEAEAKRQKQAAEAAARVEADAQAARLAALAAMSPNLRRIEEFKAAFASRAEQLRGGTDSPNAVFHGKARELARDAAEWSAEEKRAAVDAIEEWLPRVVRVDMKEERKKLKLSTLRAP